MRFTKIVTALLACLALGAFAANGAQAAVGDGWTIGTTENQTTAGTLIPFGTKEKISCKKHGTSKLLFTSKLLTATVELEAEGVDCLEKAGSTNSATIDNGFKFKNEKGEELEQKIKGHSEGVLTFTGVKVLKPENCEVGGTTHDLTTNPLTDEVIMDPTAGSTVVFDRFFPEVAANGFLTIEFKGTKCSLLEDEATVKGNACGEAVHTDAAGNAYESNKTGTLTKVQTLLFGEAQQKTGNSTAKPCAITFGPEAAQLFAVVDNELASGKPFGFD